MDTSQDVLHPLIQLPQTGQVLPILTLFQKKSSRHIVYSGIAATALLYIMTLLAGISSMNFKMILSTLPFIVMAVLTVRSLRQPGS